MNRTMNHDVSQRRRIQTKNSKQYDTFSENIKKT